MGDGVEDCGWGAANNVTAVELIHDVPHYFVKSSVKVMSVTSIAEDVSVGVGNLHCSIEEIHTELTIAIIGIVWIIHFVLEMLW